MLIYNGSNDQNIHNYANLRLTNYLIINNNNNQMFITT